MLDWRQVGVVVSSICGWLYFIAWSLSFYPQPWLNARKRNTEGLTPDFPKLNVVGFACYTISQTVLFYSPTVRAQYAARHPLSPEPTTRFNDVAFGIHALILCAITYSQFYPTLWGWEKRSAAHRRASKATDGFITGSALAIIIVTILIFARTGNDSHNLAWQWLDLMFTFQYTKLALTVVKYVPQVVFNARRRSTKGWAMGGMQCDFVGGILSLVQLVIDSSLQADWSGLTGNPVKFGLANISLAFDIMFFVQHYILYGPVEPTPVGRTDASNEETPLLR